MTKLILIISYFLLSSAVTVESIYSHSVISIEGNNKPLNAYLGKKMLIITLPTVQNASNYSLLHSLDSLRAANPGSLVIIGVPAYEDGYTPAIKESLKTWYRSILNNNIIITEGLYTRKTSGSQQHPLFKFLTDKERNGHFNRDISGPGNKFFVWTDGELMGVLGPQTRLGSPAMISLLLGQ